jgi:putative membrane protein
MGDPKVARAGGRRPSLSDVGEPPDPRFSFANERTFLAWNRTALALIVSGLAGAEFLDFDGAELVIALPLILLGTTIALVSYGNWDRNERALRLGLPLQYRTLDRFLALGIAASAVIAAVIVVLR